MALFKKLKGSNSKSSPDLKQIIDSNSNKQEEVAPASSKQQFSTKEARASRSTDNLRSTPPPSPTKSQPDSPATTPSTTPRKAWVPKQRGLVPQPAIPYRHVPTHAATDAFRTLQGRGEKPSNYWQNLGVFPRGGRQPPRRSQSSSEISTGSIDSVLCSCAAMKADDGYYHPLLASEMRHCNHSPIRKMRQGSSRGSSTTSSTPASSVYSVPISTSSKASSMRDLSVIKPSKSVTFSDALLNRLEEEVQAAVNDPGYLTEPVPPIPVAFMLPSSDDDASTDSGLPSIAEAVVLESPLEEKQEEVVAEAIADDDARSVRAFEVDGIVYATEYLGNQFDELQMTERQESDRG